MEELIRVLFERWKRCVLGRTLASPVDRLVYRDGGGGASAEAFESRPDTGGLVSPPGAGAEYFVLLGKTHVYH